MTRHMDRYDRPALPPIYQCEDGHVVCESCYRLPDLTACPACLAPLAGRNSLVETVAKLVLPDTSPANNDI